MCVSQRGPKKKLKGEKKILHSIVGHCEDRCLLGPLPKA